MPVDKVNTAMAQSNEEYFRCMQKNLESWFQTALGRSLLANQRMAIESVSGNMFGVYQAEIGISHRIPVGNMTQIGHRFFMLPQWQQDLPQNTLISSSEEIALDHEMIDLAILHHALDVSYAPHQTLREVSRILKPSGHLIIVGFNPVSTWGLRRILARRSRVLPPWSCRFISGRRIEDWLGLLDFKIAALDYHFYALPFNQTRLINRFQGLDHILNAKVPLGAYYVISAQKQVGARVKRSKRWRQKAKVVGLPVANRIDPND